MAKSKIDNTDFGKVRKMLKSLNDGEYRYLEMTMGFVTGMKELIRKFKLDKKTFCEMFKINPRIYNDYIKGNYNYSVKDMAMLHCVFMELETKALEKKVPVQVVGEQERKEKESTERKK